jgi:hypothetical protein
VFKVAGGNQQVHDFNPGEENGLFWTVAIPEDSVDSEFEDGSASLSLKNFTIDDYGNVVNALSGGKEIATASLSVRIRWSGLRKKLHARQPGLPTPFEARELQGVNSGATMTWSAVENGAHFSGDKNTADFAMLAREKNGVFFDSDSEDD